MKFFLLVFNLILLYSLNAQNVVIEGTPSSNKAFNSYENDFNFVVVADRTGSHRDGVFKQALDKINMLQPEFVISVGDLIEGYTTNENIVNKQWTEFDENISKLDMPFFYIAGNHDFTNSNMKKIWNEKFNYNEYYFFIYKNNLFLCLNTESQVDSGKTGYIGKQQFDFIKKILENNKNVNHTFVFMHKPLWRENYMGGYWSEVEKLLNPRKHTVFSGHEHSYVKTNRNNGEYFVLATTGGVSGMNGVTVGEFDHITFVNVKNNKPYITNIDINGIIDKNVVDEAKKQIIEQASDNPPFQIYGIYVDDIKQFNKSYTNIKITNDNDFPVKFHFTEYNSKNIAAFVHDKEIFVDAKSGASTKFNLIKILSGNIDPVKITIDATYYYKENDSVIIPFTYNFSPLEKFTLNEINFEVEIDGDESEWGEFDYSWELKDVQSKAYYSIYYDNNYVYFGIKVIDDTVVSYGEGAAFKQDNVGFGFSPSPKDVSAMSQGKHWYKYEFWQLITPENDKVQSVYYREMPEGSKSICIQKDYGYFAEIAVPIDIIKEKQGENWRTIRVNLAIDDNDGDGDVERFWWQPNWMNNKVNIIGSGMFFKN